MPDQADADEVSAAPPDRALLDAWRGGDAGAGERLVERHWGVISRFFRHKVGDDAGDLITTTFLALVERRDDIVGEDVRAYLLAIARRRLIDHLRGLDRARAFDPALSSLAAVAPGPASQLAAAQQAELLHQALAELPLDDQLALELAYFEELPGRELALVLGVGEHTVRSRLARARDRLREALTSLARARGAGPDAAAAAESQLGPAGR
jgi:RNA polymerase sigma factor (sigma-70 family)